MPTERLSMRHIREVLRLHHAVGLSQRATATSLGLAQGTVSKYINRVRRAGLTWPLPPELDDDVLLENRLYPPPSDLPSEQRSQPDWTLVHRELRRPGVTLMLLWEEYCDSTPEAFSYSWFCEHYKDWAGRLKPTLRQVHVAGERLFVDYSGHTMEVIDGLTGEVRPVEIFVAVLGASIPSGGRGMGDTGGARNLPQGTVTFLFTDLEGSTALLQAHPAGLPGRRAPPPRPPPGGRGGPRGRRLRDGGGRGVRGLRPPHRRRARRPWPGSWPCSGRTGATGAGALRARMGVHLGEVEAPGRRTTSGARSSRCARLMATAHGGQVVLSEAAVALVRDALPARAGLLDLGEHRLKDLQRPERVFQLTAPGLPGDFPALRTLDALPPQPAPAGHQLRGAGAGAGGGRAAPGHHPPADPHRHRGHRQDPPGPAGGGGGHRGVPRRRLVRRPGPAGRGGAGARRRPRRRGRAGAGTAGAPAAPEARLVAHLRPWRALLLLDNCEHLLEACARLADGLLRAHRPRQPPAFDAAASSAATWSSAASTASSSAAPWPRATRRPPPATPSSPSPRSACGCPNDPSDTL